MSEVDPDIVTSPCGYCSTPAITKCANCKLVFYCDRECQKKHWKIHKKECQQRDDQELSADDTSHLELKVEVRPSAVHGLGVFATTKICCNEKLCYYNGDVTDARIQVKMGKLPNGSLKIRNASEVFGSILGTLENVDRCMAHPDPKFSTKVKLGNMNDKSGFGIGQFVNDSHRPHLNPAEMDFCQCSDELKRYQLESLKSVNCEISGNNFWLRATRDIEEGEEIFMHYGYQFWLRKYLLEATSPEDRFMFYALHNQSLQPFNLTKFFDYDDETCSTFLTDLIRIPASSLENLKSVKKYIFEMTMRISRFDPDALK